MARIYTRQGDAGETRLSGGSAVRKSDTRVEAYGAVDELNAHVGVARTMTPDSETAAILASAQEMLFELGGDLANPDAPGDKITPQDISDLEAAVDKAMADAPELRAFVLPGGSALAAQLHVARTVCRRAERRVVELAETAPVSATALAYLNRLSDLLFALARQANALDGCGDIEWMPRPASTPPE